MEQPSFQNPLLAELWPKVERIVRVTVDAIPPELLDPHAGSAEIDLYALFDPDDGWQMAQLALDVLGTSLSDEFGAMRLSAPMEFESRILLRLRVAVPSPAADEFIARLPSAVELLFHELVGTDASPTVSAAFAEDADRAVPRDTPSITPYTGGSVPEGHVVLVDQFGDRRLLDIEAAKAARDKGKLSELTPDQERRIEAFKRVLSEHELTSLEDALANFRRDRTPEREIQVWERIARTYEDELSVRPLAGTAERRLLYRVILARSLASDMGGVLQMVPSAKALANLARAIERYGDVT
jgi:hypothetical protein